MIAVDTNILVYAHRSESKWNRAAAERMRELAEGTARWVLPWPCIHEFLVVVTHPRIFLPPTPPEIALRQAELWMESPSCGLAGEGVEHWRLLTDLLERGQVTGPAVHDARIAAICMEQGVDVLWTADRDFSRFPIRTANPLLGS